MPQHKLPPARCSTNLPTFTDSTITDRSTKVRKVHLDELRSYLSTEFTRRYLLISSFTDPTITANVTRIRKIHVDELRTQLGVCKTGNSESGYCPEDTSGCMDFTDPTITANVTSIRGTHFRELRSKVQTLMSGCICETEQCQYCADCGYSYSYCNHNGVVCADHNMSEGCGQTVWSYTCGSTNLAIGTSHPYKAFSTGGSATAWDGYVPWDWCSFAPPGDTWRSCEFAGGHTHTDWNCKCNPYTW